MLKYEIIPVTHYQQNCSLIWCDHTGDAAVIDPGGDLPKILARIDDLKLNLRQVLLTHGHLDHAGSARQLAEIKAISINGPHLADEFWLKGLLHQSQMMGFPPHQPFVSDHYLKEGDVIAVGQEVLSVLHCPGHTPGHLVFYHSPSKMAWVGDVIFNGSIGRTDFPKGNLQELISSIRDKLFPLGEDVKFVPGHGPMSTFGHERLHNPFVADKRFG